MKLDLSEATFARGFPVMVSKRDIGHVRRRVADKGAEWLGEHVPKPIVVVETIRAQRGATGIDVIPGHDAKVANRNIPTELLHRIGDCIHAGCWNGLSSNR